MKRKNNKKNKKTKQIRIYLILLLLILGFFIRFFPVRIGFHYWDECVYLQHAEIMAGNREASLFNEFDIRPPLLPLLIAGIYQFSHSLIAAHLIVVLISSLGIILIFLLARELFNEKVAFISALIYTFLPLHIFFSHDILVDSILPTMWLLAFLFTIKTIKTNKFYFSVLAGIFIGLAILLKFSSLLLPVFVFIAFIIYDFKKEGKERKTKWREVFIKTFKDKRFWIIILFVFLTLVPYMIWISFYFGNPLYSIVKGYLILNWDTPTSWTILYKDFNQMFPYPLLIGLAALFFFNLKNKKTTKGELLLWISFLGIFFSMHTMQHKEIRFLLPVSPFITILSAAGLFSLFSFINKKRAPKAIIIVAIMLIAIIILSPLRSYLSSHYFSSLKENNFIIDEESNHMTTAIWLKENTPENAIVYVNTQYPVVAYFSERKVIVLPFWKRFEANEITEIMPNFGYFVLFQETAETRDPKADVVKNDSRFKLMKEFGVDKNKIFIYEYTPSSNQKANFSSNSILSNDRGYVIFSFDDNQWGA